MVTGEVARHSRSTESYVIGMIRVTHEVDRPGKNSES